MKKPSVIQCKRVYDPPENNDGYRVLVDRIWPRGVNKTDLAMDDWCKELAPSTELRRWFNHDAQRWAAFYQKYHAELTDQQEIINHVLSASNNRPLTLLYSARDRKYNNAVALKMYLEKLVSDK